MARTKAELHEEIIRLYHALGQPFGDRDDASAFLDTATEDLDVDDLRDFHRELLEVESQRNRAWARRIGAPLWMREHPNADVPDSIANDPRLEDTSWHNDICPSFTAKGHDLESRDVRLWVDYREETRREYPDVDLPRYRVIDLTSDPSDGTVFETDDDIAGAIDALLAACKGE
jgi:hypothetical protein